MTRAEDIKRLNAIVDGASKLPVENQECILFTIRGMLFTRDVMMRKQKNEKINTGNVVGSS